MRQDRKSCIHFPSASSYMVINYTINLNVKLRLYTAIVIPRTKTEYLPSPTNDTGTTVKLVDGELLIVTSFKYLGTLFTSEGGSQADVNNRIRIGWMKWKEVSGVMCDRTMPVELRDKVFKTIMRPAMTYGSEWWAVKKKDENKLNSAEMRMLRWARGKTRLDHIRNEDIRKEAHVKPVATFLENKRLILATA